MKITFKKTHTETTSNEYAIFADEKEVGFMVADKALSPYGGQKIQDYTISLFDIKEEPTFQINGKYVSDSFYMHGRSYKIENGYESISLAKKAIKAWIENKLTVEAVEAEAKTKITFSKPQLRNGYSFQEIQKNGIQIGFIKRFFQRIEGCEITTHYKIEAKNLDFVFPILTGAELLDQASKMSYSDWSCEKTVQNLHDNFVKTFDGPIGGVFNTAKQAILKIKAFIKEKVIKTEAVKLDAKEIAKLLNEKGYTYYGEKARGWIGTTTERVYFGRDFVTIKNGKIITPPPTLTIGESALEAVEAVLEAVENQKEHLIHLPL